MALYAWALLALVAAAVSADVSRVLDGQAVAIESYPFVVQVDFLQPGGVWSQACAGALISTKWTLSAAQCFSGASYPGVTHRRIRAGTAKRNSRGVLYTIARVINHPDYGLAAPRDSDLSLVELSTLATLSSTIQTVSINVAGSELPGTTAVRLLGWGQTRLNGPSSLQLRDGIANNLALETCASRYDRGSITTNMFCTLSSSAEEQTSCQGDNGGPVVLNNVVVGLVSWGNGCVVSSYPAVHTKVSAFTNWIVANAV
ncbi:unnamed protein product [Plutella xylostella]|uniref:(diamondback moth) hypothetical protein n=1 Tax=Plutella xylostella TaxID=51655 RepID=A0A8S4ELJ0_PLUXY|nr:unnamed protein product [Plutella xylostella]